MKLYNNVHFSKCINMNHFKKSIHLRRSFLQPQKFAQSQLVLLLAESANVESRQ
jgi:hypothetical protein